VPLRVEGAARTMRGADQAITNAIDAHVQAERAEDGDDEGGTAGVLVPAG